MTVVEAPLTGQLDLEELSKEEFVAFNSGGSLPPLVMIRTWFAELPHYQRLARHLGPEQPIITMGHPVGDSNDDYPSHVEEWRDFCLIRLKELETSQPLWIGGWSFGGVVALEMVRSLQAEGREVAQVVMLDTRIPKKKARRGLAGLQQLAIGLHEYTMMGTKQERRAYVRSQVAEHTDRTRKKWKRARQQRQGERTPGEAAPASQAPPDPLTRAIRVCYLKYHAQKIDVPVLQFWTQESRRRVGGDLTLGWSQALEGELQLVAIPGDHKSMFAKEHSPALAQSLRSGLEQARIRERVRSERPDQKPK